MPDFPLTSFQKSIPWHRIGATLRSVWRIAHGLFPLTWMSVILAVLIYYVWYWEVSAHANQILYAAVSILIFAWAIQVIFTLISTALVYSLTRSHNRTLILEAQNEVGGHLDSAYAVFSPFFLPFVTVETEIMESQAFVRHEKRHSIWTKEWLEPIGRGRFEKLHRKITVKDIFGLTSMTFVMPQPVSLEIQPATSKFEMMAFQTRTTGDGYSHPEGDPRGELVEMRRYQAGDPLKLILWKVFARSRKLVVRAPEPAIVEQNDMFVYFISGPKDEASASMARSFLSSFGVDDGDLCFAADGAKRLVSNEKEGLSDVIDSVSHQNRGGEDLMTVAPFVSQNMMAHCFLLVPQKLGPWLDYVKKFISHYGIQPVFIVSVDGSKQQSQAKPRSKWQKLWLAMDEIEHVTDEFQRLCNALTPLGTVRIMDVSTGTMTNL
jgi:hypothetical protein